MRGSADEGGSSEQAPDDGMGQPSGREWVGGGVLAEGEAMRAGG